MKKNKSRSAIGDLKWENEKDEVEVAETDSEKANALEKFFSSVFTIEGDFDLEVLPKIEIKKTFTRN